jgi:hypothetical protein
VYCVVVETNLVDITREKVVFGPYTFPSWEVRKVWERRFNRAITALNAEILGGVVDPYRVKAVFRGGGMIDDSEVMLPPAPEEAVRNLRFLWDRETIGLLIG